MAPANIDPNDLLSSAQGIDVIGDIHGHLAPLERLLLELGYDRMSGIWRHSEGRKALFLGDLVDRGPSNMGVVQTVRSMVEAGEAVCLMGNHELNAVHFSMEDPQVPGRHLRARSDKNIGQHVAFLREYHAGPEARDRMRKDLAWFASLPLWIELPGLRAVHACWSQAHIDRLADPLVLAGPDRSDVWQEAADTGRPLGEAVDVILKGAEIKLPDNVSFEDKDGHVRKEARLKWWSEGSSWRDAVIGTAPLYDAIAHLEGSPDSALSYGDDEKPVFFSHYWMSARNGAPELTRSPNVCCLDYSVARPGGLLAAYRWDGEETLSSERLMWAKGTI
ncbi:metallophosphoesterase [Hyphomonadaceae bacterium BL14]|nr:metallophosphoesterase [Hyphomonadaceae bacterium BL14]